MPSALQRLAARALGLATREELAAVVEAVTREDLYEPGWRLVGSGDGVTQPDPTQILEIQREAQNAWLRDPLIKQAVRVKRVFTLGAGISFTAEDPQAERALREFWSDPLNRLFFQQADWFHSLAVMSELCLRFWTGPDGRVQVRLIPAAEIQDVITDPDDRHVLRYIWRRYTYREFDPAAKSWREEQRDELIPGEEVLFIAIESPPGWVRGLSQLYAAIPWAKAYAEWLQDRARINKAKGAYVWLRKLKGGAAAIAKSAQDLAAKIGGAVRSATGTSEAPALPPPKVGSVITTNDAVEWDILNAKIGADDAKEDGRALRLQVAAATNVFEHYLTGDPSTGNLATAKSMELPMRREFEWWQGLMAHILRAVFRRVLEAQVAAGRLPETYTVTKEVYRDGRVVEITEQKAMVDCPVDINFPPLRTEDRKDLVQAAQIEQQMGIKSDATIASELGVEDWEQEQARLYKERQEREARRREEMSQQYPPFPGQPPAGDGGDGDE